MKIRAILFKVVIPAAALFASGASAFAQGLTNNFTTAFDYVAHGIVGDTNWDGIYLNFGDVPNNTGPGANGPASTTIANSAINYPGYLSFRSLSTDWAGPDDDGVFIWKYVGGDFDVSVQSSPFDLNGGLAFDNRANNFCGLMVRAYNTNNSGAPYNATNNANTENYEMLWRFQEFNLNEVNDAVNGGRIEHTFFDTNTATAETRYFRIVRSSLTNFTFYWKTNATDAWVPITSNFGGTLVRPLLTGPLQVGIAQGAFSTATRDAVFTDFELIATNVSFPAFPAAPSAVVTTATNTGGSLTFSWTVGDPVHDSSLVIVRANGNIQGSPIQGLVYPANATYGTTGTALSVGNQYVVFNGAGNSVTVTNLAGNNILYTVAVYEYSNSATPVYNTASPATNTFPGPGVITSVVSSVGPTNIPIGGAALGSLFATFTSGTNQIDESAVAIWASSDPTIAAWNGRALTGVTNGTVTVTGSFGGFSASQVITVHSPVFTDNFANSADYLANGVAGGAGWDGVYLSFGDVPGGNIGSGDNVAGQCFILNANIQATNALYVQESGGSWRLNGNDGPYLFKVVTGDFQASVHVITDTINNNYAGLMARLYNNSGAGLQGGPGGTGNTETHVNWGDPQQNITSRRVTIDAGGTAIVGGLATDRWFLMQRVNSTNFFFFEKANPGDNWSAVPAVSTTIAEASNSAPMQVGLFKEMRAATVGFAQFDTLMIDGPGITQPATPPPPATNFTSVLNGDLSMTFNWVAASATGTPIRSMLIMRAGGPVTAVPTLAQAGAIGGTGTPVTFGAGLSLGGSNWMVFATGNPAPSTNVSCTVNGLTPGVIYYAAVVTFTGSGGAKAFNIFVPTNDTTSLQDGVLQSVSVQPPPSIPLGGVQIPQVIGVFGGSPVNVSQFATWSSANSNIAQVASGSGVISGMGIGSTTMTNIYKGFTNTISVTVRAATFNDEFNVSQNYVVNRQTNSPWSGVYLNQGDIPESTYVSGAPGNTTIADANISAAGMLTVTQAFGGWAANQDDGFFLFKYVPGDFQAAVHIANTNNLGGAWGFNEAGLLARLYSTGTNGTDLGAPYTLGTVTNGTVNFETWVGFTKFDEFGFGTYARKNIANIEFQFTQPNPGSPDNWLLILRQNHTNFYFYERATNTAPWALTPKKTSFSGAGGALPDFAGQPMQVGIQLTPYTPGPLMAQFEHFMLDVESGSGLQISNGSGGNVIVSWPPIPGQLQSSTNVVPTSWQNVSGSPVLGPNGYSLSVPLSGRTMFFRLVQ